MYYSYVVPKDNSYYFVAQGGKTSNTIDSYLKINDKVVEPIKDTVSDNKLQKISIYFVKANKGDKIYSYVATGSNSWNTNNFYLAELAYLNDFSINLNVVDSISSTSPINKEIIIADEGLYYLPVFVSSSSGSTISVKVNDVEQSPMSSSNGNIGGRKTRFYQLYLQKDDKINIYLTSSGTTGYSYSLCK